MRAGHHLHQDCGGNPSSLGGATAANSDMGNTGRREMDHLVKEIKENLKLSAPPPPSLGAVGGGGVGPASAGGKIKSSGGGGKAGRSYSHRVGARPYHVPPSSRQCDSASGTGAGGCSGSDSAAAMTLSMRRKQRWGRRRYPSTCMNNNKFVPEMELGTGSPDDPFAMLQELISDGSLIKEAVRRLQLGPEAGPEGCFSAGRLTPGSGNNRAGSGRQTAYDSDSDNEDCRTPPEIDDPHNVVQQEAASGATVATADNVRVSSLPRTFPCCEVGL